MIDLASINTKAACEKAVEFELEHPVTGEKLGEFISLLGPDSEIAVANIRKQLNEQRRKASLAIKTGKEVALNQIEQDEADTIEKLVACTTGFRCEANDSDQGGNYLHFNGKLEFTPENARKLYSDDNYIWIRRFLIKKHDNLANFMQG